MPFPVLWSRHGSQKKHATQTLVPVPLAFLVSSLEPLFVLSSSIKSAQLLGQSQTLPKSRRKSRSESSVTPTISLQTFPVELCLEIASYLPLRDLILFRNASGRLRSVVNANIASIRPSARQNLLRLWDRVITSLYFLPSRPHIVPHLRGFDRHAFISSFQYEGKQLQLPAEFETWILEWPAKATIGWAWPGLDQGPYLGLGHDYYNAYYQHPWWRLPGQNPFSNPERGAASCVCLFTGLHPSGQVVEGNASTVVWRFEYDSERRLNVTEAASQLGFGFPVWAVLPGGLGRWYGIGHMLILSGLGPGYDGSVQLFDEGYNYDMVGPPGELFITDHPGADIWHNSRTHALFRGQSWTDWLKKHLEALEKAYLKEVERHPILAIF